ncbi:MAG: alpha-rhamnosidase [Verrucomicrobiales bacterium]|nr:alpha-rhamnosidase [Verrucomicrobiales bacterium]
MRSVSTFFAATLFATSLQAGFHPVRLRCEYLDNPLGIERAAPRLSWEIKSKERDQKQSAYEIIVASSPANLKKNRGDLWDSGKIDSDETAQIAYGGKQLASRQHCFWKVRTWDQDGKVSTSETATWEMGLLDPADWNAKWIGRTTDTNYQAAPFLRRAFSVEKKIKEARVYICGLGYYELHLNGAKVGNHLLDPGYTRYDKRDLYVTYDVTENLKRGNNAIGVILGTGWYNCHTRAVWNFHEAPWREAPKLLLSLEITYTDGTNQRIVSDEQWRTSTGPITFDSIYAGETYDARLEQSGWDTGEFRDTNWERAKIVEAPKGKISAQANVPIRAFETITPIKVSEPKPGVFIFDMGQNFAGFCELKVKGPAGTKVQLRHGERLFEDGSLDTQDIEKHVKKLDPSQTHQTDTYILRGGRTEKWHSRFDYHGFQYVEVTGFPGKPTLDNLKGIFIHSAVPAVGKFESSNVLFNKIARNARWSYLSNLQGIPTDCPHREKNGWTGDAHLAAEQGLFTFDASTVYTKWINDLGDEQRPTGMLPGIVPTAGWGYTWGNGPAWDSAFLLIPSHMYQYYGDTQILRDHFDGFKRYVDYLTSKAKNNIVDIGLNDWAPYKTKTPADVTSTAYYYRDAQITALAALYSGNEAEARKYTKLANDIKTAFNKKFLNPQTGSYGNGSQTALSCALYQGLCEPENKRRVLDNLVKAVEKSNWHIDTGILGSKYLLNALLENGRADVAYRIAAQKDLPSWGYWIEQGATTLWEQWSGAESRNHIMYGDVVACFYKAFAGINPDPTTPGFKHFMIRPNVVGELTYAKAEYDSIRGKIVSDWEMVNGEFRLNVTIPANTVATVYLPISDESTVRESGKPARKAKGVQFVRAEPGHTIFEVGSGNYKFTGPLAK